MHNTITEENYFHSYIKLLYVYIYTYLEATMVYINGANIEISKIRPLP